MPVSSRGPRKLRGGREPFAALSLSQGKLRESKEPALRDPEPFRVEPPQGLNPLLRGTEGFGVLRERK